MTAITQDFYSKAIKSLSAPERLDLATLLLQSIPREAVVDYSDEWTEEDLREFSAHCRNRIFDQLEAEEQDAAS